MRKYALPLSSSATFNYVDFLAGTHLDFAVFSLQYLLSRWIILLLDSDLLNLVFALDDILLAFVNFVSQHNIITAQWQLRDALLHSWFFGYHLAPKFLPLDWKTKVIYNGTGTCLATTDLGSCVSGITTLQLPCYNPNVCDLPPNFYGEIQTPIRDGIRRYDL